MVENDPLVEKNDPPIDPLANNPTVWAPQAVNSHATCTSRFAMLMLLCCILSNTWFALDVAKEELKWAQLSSPRSWTTRPLQRDRLEARRCNGLSASMSCFAPLDWPESTLWSIIFDKSLFPIYVRIDLKYINLIWVHLTRTSRFAMLMLVFLPLKHLVRAVRSEREDQVSSVTLATFMDDTSITAWPLWSKTLQWT